LHLFFVSLLTVSLSNCAFVEQNDRKKSKKSLRLRSARRRRRKDSGSLSESETITHDVRTDSDLSEGMIHSCIVMGFCVVLHLLYSITVNFL